jgi:hypothetical protein
VALQDLEEEPPLRPWLFRIAHNRALDLLRSREVRMVGRLLMIGAEHRAQRLKMAGLSLTTFRTPPWSGPWFRRQGYSNSRGTHRSWPSCNFGSCNISRHGDARDSLEAERCQSGTGWRWVGEAREGQDSRGS